MAGWEGLTSCPAKKYIFFETNWGNTVHIQCKAGRGDDMEDEEIIELFWSRDEEAVTSVQAGYGKMCAQVAGNILKDEEDVRECLNDVWLALWNWIPPERPRILPAYIRRVARNLALKRYRYNQAGKRCEQVEESLEKLEGMLCAPETVETAYDARELARYINSFVRSLPREKGDLFIRRYWYFDSVEQLARDFGMSQGRVKTMLFRMRGQLREALRKEGYKL